MVDTPETTPHLIRSCFTEPCPDELLILKLSAAIVTVCLAQTKAMTPLWNFRGTYVACQEPASQTRIQHKNWKQSREPGQLSNSEISYATATLAQPLVANVGSPEEVDNGLTRRLPNLMDRKHPIHQRVIQGTSACWTDAAMDTPSRP